jgi:hypothetical protein
LEGSQLMGFSPLFVAAISAANIARGSSGEAPAS